MMKDMFGINVDGLGWSVDKQICENGCLKVCDCLNMNVNVNIVG